MLCMTCGGSGFVSWHIKSEHNYPPGTPPDIKCECKDCKGTGYLILIKEEEKCERSAA